MKISAALTIALFAATLGCNSNSSPSPDQVRHDTAAATATVASDVKAAAEGVRDGLHQAHDETHQADLVNINTAPRRALESLPGVDVLVANEIIRHRPYNSPSDLVTKGAITRGKYDELSGRIKTSD